MLSNNMQWAVAHRAAAFGELVFGGTTMPASPAAALARKTRIADAGYAQGDHCAWSPPV